MVYLPPEIMDMIFSFHNPYLGLEKRINNIYKKMNKELIKNVNIPNDYKNISRCIDEIPNIFIPRKTVWIGSYKEKHIVEKYRDIENPMADNYISTEDFIIAMLICGHNMKTYKRRITDCNFYVRNPYCEFYVSQKK